MLENILAVSFGFVHADHRSSSRAPPNALFNGCRGVLQRHGQVLGKRLGGVLLAMLMRAADWLITAEAAAAPPCPGFEGPMGLRAP